MLSLEATIQESFPVFKETGITLKDDSLEKKLEYIKKLVEYLGGNFFLYSKGLSSFSKKDSGPYLGIGPVLFLPFDIEQYFPFSLACLLESNLQCRIKFISSQEELIV